MVLDIGCVVSSDLKSLEDVFLGATVGYKGTVQRIYSEYDPETNEFKEVSRSHDVLKDVIDENTVSCLNYNELNYSYWNHLVYGYLHDFCFDKLLSFKLNALEYLGREDIDFSTKKLNFNILYRALKKCLAKLSAYNAKNEFELDLINVFVSIYNSTLDLLKSHLFDDFRNDVSLLKVGVEMPFIDNEQTKSYGILLEVGFLDDCNAKNSKPIIDVLCGNWKKYNVILYKQNHFFVFCEKVGLLSLVASKYHSNAKSVGEVLGELFGDKSGSQDNFKRYFSAMSSKNHKHYPFTHKAVNRAEEVLQILEDL